VVVTEAAAATPGIIFRYYQTLDRANISVLALYIGGAPEGDQAIFIEVPPGQLKEAQRLIE